MVSENKMRILLVEDDEMIGEAVADGLKGEGYAVDWVKDGNSAIIALDTTPFSLVILDLGLPGIKRNSFPQKPYAGFGHNRPRYRKRPH